MFGLFKSASEWYREGNDALRANDNHKAIECYRKSIAKEPNGWPAYSNMGAAYSGLEQHQDALECFNIALQINPYDPATLGNRAISRKELGDLHGALEDENLTIQYDPGNPNHYLNRARTKQKLGHYLSSVDDCTKGVGLPSLGNWHQARLYSTRAIGRYYAQQWDWARDDMTYAIQHKPESLAYYYLWRGAINLGAGKTEDALQDYLRGLRDLTGNAASAAHRAAPLIERKQYREAAGVLSGVKHEEEALVPLVEYLEKQKGG